MRMVISYSVIESQDIIGRSKPVAAVDQVELEIWTKIARILV